MIIHDFNIEGVSVIPFEADPPPVIDPQTVLPLSFPVQGFKPISRWHSKVTQRLRTIEHSQFSESRPVDIPGKSPREQTPEYPLRFPAPERSNHGPTI
jgi:hypothetical protein